MTNDKFLEFVKESKSISELANKMGFPFYYNGKRLSGTAYREIKRKCYECNIDYKSLSRKKNSPESLDNSLIEHVPNCKNFTEVIKKLGLIHSGSSHAKIVLRIKKLKLDVSHFTGQAWSAGLNRFSDERVNNEAKKVETPWEKAFCIGSSVKNDNLMKRLVLAGKKEYKCSICGLSEWNSKPIRLRLDHIDGDCINSSEDNLRIICPNCDSQTDTFCRGKKKKICKTAWWQQI